MSQSDHWGDTVREACLDQILVVVKSWLVDRRPDISERYYPCPGNGEGVIWDADCCDSRDILLVEVVLQIRDYRIVRAACCRLRESTYEIKLRGSTPFGLQRSFYLPCTAGDPPDEILRKRVIVQAAVRAWTRRVESWWEYKLARGNRGWRDCSGDGENRIAVLYRAPKVVIRRIPVRSTPGGTGVQRVGCVRHICRQKARQTLEIRGIDLGGRGRRHGGGIAIARFLGVRKATVGESGRCAGTG